MERQYKIICVDDEKDVLELYVDELSQFGYEVITFESPSEALGYIEQYSNEIIFIFSDYSMPDINGIEFREKSLSFSYDIPFALITGFYNKEMAVKGMELRICSFIEKPFSFDNLNKLILEHVDKRKETLNEEKEMIVSFVEESFPMLEEIEDLILVLEDDPQNEQALNTYFRLLHTIKGTASCVGLKSLPAYTHKYEDLVGKLKEKKISVNRTVIDTLLAGLDQLKLMYADIKSFQNVEPDISKEVEIFDQDFAIETIEVKEVVEKEKKTEVVSKQEEDKINVNVSVLDSFMEISGELTVVRNTILKAASKLEQKYFGDKDVEVLSDALDEMHKYSSSLQGEISELRKVSLETIYRPLKRVVRDASKMLGKSIKFSTSGDALRIDTKIGKVLNNALVHLIRNGIDHGIEIPEKRVEAGKSAEGEIFLDSYEEGENIIVEIKDDGNGMDPEIIKSKALENELFTQQELDNMPEHRVYSLIFESGFSTAAQVTDLSGRGVGMDMVKSSVEEIGGRILTDSKLGEGSKFVLVIPIPRSVLIIKSLMVSVSESKFCIPLENVAEVVNFDQSKKDAFHEIEGAKIINHHEELIPLIEMRKILGMEDHNKDISSIVIVKGDGFRYGIIVDRIHDIEEVVAKNLVDQLRTVGCYTGVTLVGDGEMAMILDLQGLAELAHIKINEDESELDNYLMDKTVDSDIKEFMQFDLSKNKNFALPLADVSRLEEFESSKVEFSGNVAIIRYRNDFLPLVFVEESLDLGKGKAEYLSERDLLPVIVVQFNNKAYGFVVGKIGDIGISDSELNILAKDREGLSGTIFIDDKTISVINTKHITENYKSIPLGEIQESVNNDEKEKEMAA
jgi:two-component system chemotaxis sensor kinase CheA